jgi:hypothetical protein
VERELPTDLWDWGGKLKVIVTGDQVAEKDTGRDASRPPEPHTRQRKGSRHADQHCDTDDQNGRMPLLGPHFSERELRPEGPAGTNGPTSQIAPCATDVARLARRLLPILIASPTAIAIVPVPASSRGVLARNETETFIARRVTPSRVGFLRLLFNRHNIAHGLLSDYGRRSNRAAVASPSVAAGASAKAAMRSGAHVVELSPGLLVAPSTDRLFDPGISLLVEDGAFACDTGAGLLAPADAVSIGLTNVRAATDNSVA